jgi:hypothetical protein
MPTGAAVNPLSEDKPHVDGAPSLRRLLPPPFCGPGLKISHFPELDYETIRKSKGPAILIFLILPLSPFY